jgi:hypothetical protein
MASVLGFLRRRAVELALRSASVVSLLWFLYWIGYDVIVWGKPLVRANSVNYFGAVLSLIVLLAGFRLRAKKMVETSNDWQNEEQSLFPRGLEEEEGSLRQERLEFEREEKVEVRERNVDVLKSQVAELRRQVEELKLRLKTME